MNDMEIARIARAINALRPDWPVKQLTTLLSDDRMAHRPRRDAAVALVFIACDSATVNPYRVLEDGPWWKAAGGWGDTKAQRVRYDPTETCGTCGYTRLECRRRWKEDHEFESVIAVRKRRHIPDGPWSDEDIPPHIAEHEQREFEAAREAMKQAATELCPCGVPRDHCDTHDPRKAEETEETT